jgi:hypothetical protein
MLSATCTIIQCAIPDWILAVAIPIVSNPEAQYLFTVTQEHLQF